MLRTGLAADDTPACLALGGLDEFAIKPVFLTAPHHGAARIVGDFIDVVGIPVKIRDTAIILSSVQDDQIE